MRLQTYRWPFLALFLLASLFVIYFKTIGILVLATCALVALIVAKFSDPEQEVEQLRHSVRNSAAEINDVLRKWDAFHISNEPIHIADRTLYRSSLDESTCSIPEVAEFLQALQSSRSFINQLDQKLESAHSTRALERLLASSDAHVASLSATWQAARIAVTQNNSLSE